jgi:hypothetical protein
MIDDVHIWVLPLSLIAFGGSGRERQVLLLRRKKWEKGLGSINLRMAYPWFSFFNKLSTATLTMLLRL